MQKRYVQLKFIHKNKKYPHTNQILLWIFYLYLLIILQFIFIKFKICKIKNLQDFLQVFLEAPPRFELGNKGFADLCLTTWLWRHTWWLDQESNQGHEDFQSSALPTELSSHITQQRSTLPHSHPCSTIDAVELNFPVRNGKECFLYAIITRCAMVF